MGTEGVRAERSASGAGERRDERQERQYRAGDAMVDLEQCVSFGEGRDIQVWSNGMLVAGRKLGSWAEISAEHATSASPPLELLDWVLIQC